MLKLFPLTVKLAVQPVPVQKKKIAYQSPPRLPKTHGDYMATQNIPDKCIKTADNGDFIISKN